MAPLPYSLPDAGDGDAADALDWGPGVSNVPAALEGLPYGNFSKVNDKIGRIADFSTSSYGHKYQGEYGHGVQRMHVRSRRATWPKRGGGSVDQFGRAAAPPCLSRARPLSRRSSATPHGGRPSCRNRRRST